LKRTTPEAKMPVEEVVAALRGMANPENVAGMARFGITGKQVLGVPVVQLRALAKRIGRSQDLAEQVRATGIVEARLLGAFLGEPKRITLKQARDWVRDFENWADCDGVCIHLLRKTTFAHPFALECTRRKAEFVKRAGFSLIATLAVHDKATPDAVFRGYLDRVCEEADDSRNGVKKAVNWALRQIGKRSPELRGEAICAAEKIRARGTPAAKWIASDALRELGHQKEKCARKRVSIKVASSAEI
jgi:3-methyladenine DNA glycosylase AlkD